MAKLKPDNGVWTLEQLHKRGYYRSSWQGHPVIRTFARYTVPRSPGGTPAQRPRYHGSMADANRAWHALVLKWWADGNIPNGAAWWDALAAAVQIETYPGHTITVNGFKFFVWFQRRSLLAEHWANYYFYPTPTWTSWGRGLINQPYPDQPVLPWTPPPTPTTLRATPTGPGLLRVDCDMPSIPDNPQWVMEVSPSPQGLQSTLFPHYIDGASLGTVYYTPTGPVENYFGRDLCNPVIPTLRRVRARIWCFDLDSRTPGLSAATDCET